MISRTQKNLLPSYALLVVFSLVSVFPFIWLIIGATNANIDILRGSMTFGTELAANWQKLNDLVNLPLVLWNTIKVTMLGTLLTLLVASMAGYGFEIFKSRARERVYQLVLLTLMIPFAALMIPLFKIFATIGLLDTHAAVIIPTIASVFIIFYFRQASKAFPSELREAARVDGMKEWQIFFYIYMPVMKSTYAAAFIIMFMTNWNNYLWPLIVLQSEDTKTITLVISSLASAYSPDYGVVLTGTLVATIPTLIVFLIMQRHFVHGMTGSVK
ncbi:MAG: carbohydrate ABC transporter permease [Saccharospirillum sp.]|uniref:carbohydrate ABC transporter permease n=1 Tax=Saccharospirillum sp. TaxID=2033801 RepID=UPI003298C4BE